MCYTEVMSTMSSSGDSSAHPRALTHRDLDHTPNDGNRWELIDGSFVVTPFPNVPHQVAATRLTTILDAHVRRHDLGMVFAAGLKVVLDEPTGVGPDLVFVSSAKLGRLRDDGYHGAPDLVVEVLSSKPELDTVVKLHKYAAAGVPNYWIVDPTGRTVKEYCLVGDMYRLECQVVDNRGFRPGLFPGLDIDLADLWLDS